MNDLFTKVKRCQRCDLGSKRTQSVPGQGQGGSVFFLGEAPGMEEDKRGLPFIGRSGETLDKFLRELGLPRESVYITNVVKCRPKPHVSFTPSPAEIASCSEWLDLEIAALQPRLMVLMGSVAIHRMLGKVGKVEHVHGRPVITEGCVYLPTYHPAATLYDTALLRHLRDDFKVLGKLLDGEDPESLQAKDLFPNPKYQEATTDSDINWLMADMEHSGVCAIDLETSHGKLWSVQISTRPGESTFVNAEMAKKLTVPPSCLVVVHNYLFDSQYLPFPVERFTDTMVMAYLLGWPQGLKELASRHCGMQMDSYDEVVLKGRRRKAIEWLTIAASQPWPDAEPVDVTLWDNKAGRVITKQRKPQPIKKKMMRILADCVDNLDLDPYWRWYQIDEQERRVVEERLGVLEDAALEDANHDEAVQYSCKDSDATLRIYFILQGEIQEAGLEPILNCVDLPILPMINSMMNNGVALNLDHLRKLSSTYTMEMEAAARRAATKVNRPFNPNSRTQVAQVVYDDVKHGGLGFHSEKKTPAKQVSTDDRELKKVDHPVIADILEYRRLAKNRDSFADALIERAIFHTDTETNRIHTILKATRTETGRLSSSKPNLQAMPVRSKEGKDIRRAFIASPGYVMLAADYAQQEMKVMAHEARCQPLIELFIAGGDAHTTTASRIFGVSMDEAKKEKYRYPTKRLNFGVIYGITAEGLANDIEEHVYEMPDIDRWSVEQCDALIKEWYKLYPEVKNFRMEKVAQAHRYDYVTDLFGRRRYVPEMWSPIASVREAGARQAGNMPIQSGSQGITKMAMAALWRSRSAYDLRFLLQIHDELLVEVREGQELSCARWLQYTMANVVYLSVPMTAGVKMGNSWGDLAKLEDKVAV